jgi:two-component system response regulator AtoC
MSQHGVFNHPLPDRGSITIGRAEHCAVTIDDPKLSREHVILRVGDVLELFDLDSSNGTRLGDKLIAPNVGTVIAPGDIFTVGGSLMVVQPAPASGARPRHLWSHAYFESRLEDECVRADETGRPFAVLRIRAAQNTRTDVLVASLSAHVSAAHVIGCYVPGEYEVLLVETASEKADVAARELRMALARSGVTVDIGVACYPHDGRTSESLVACAGARARAVAAAPPASFAGRVLTDHGALHRLRPLVERFAAATIPVLILGETGVGKEVLASMVHDLGPRAGKPLVRLNCAALTETLLESELFGHERGAFTGAVHSKAGLLESGCGGTVFLDEVGEMPLSVQAKLLRVIEAREVIRVGSTRARPIDVRFVAATNRDLEAEVARGAFRQDLYYRLNGVSIVIPPLRERVPEIAPLTMSFVEHVSRQLGKRAPTVSPAAMTLLQGYAWPGNVRELRNAVERAVLLAEDEIGPEHLPREKMHDMVLPEDSQRFKRSALPASLFGPANYGAIKNRVQRRAETARTHAVNPDTPEGLERARIVDALERCDWNQTVAAKMLGVSRRTLVSRLSEYGLTRKRSPSS